MKITVIWTWYVWLIQAVWLAKIWFQVQAIDIFPDKIEKLRRWEPTIYENWLSEMLTETLSNIDFTTDTTSISGSDIIFLCVGTPQDDEWKTDLSYIQQAARNIQPILTGKEIIIIKSTVPVGTNAMIYDILWGKNPVVSNPEFLREGLALEDFFSPDRIVLWFQENETSQVINQVMQIYGYFIEKNIPILTTDWQTAELIKYAANAFLATKITFINEIARLADSCVADIKDIRYALWLDKRIWDKFLNAGIWYGGSCFPKDVKSLIHQFQEKNLHPALISNVDSVNATQVEYFLEKIFSQYGNNLHWKTIWIFWVAFKPDTDDLRESRALIIIHRLMKAGAFLKVFDYNQKARENFEKYIYGLSTGIRNFIPITLTTRFLDITSGSDFLVMTLEDRRVLDEDFSKVKENLKDKTIFDGKNILDKHKMKELWMHYYWVGYNTQSKNEYKR